ncbi:hypothetical protein BDY24DRAFT_188736 [Mrakia frigida]|uniref:uncharacterized protein n=1 Tax=Mrakia frigida TaxID=29902 RepID=UPI003FCC123D
MSCFRILSSSRKACLRPSLHANIVSASQTASTLGVFLLSIARFVFQALPRNNFSFRSTDQGYFLSVKMSGPFTDFPDMAPTVVFPRPAMQSFSAVVFLSGVTILSYITSRRSLSLNPFSPTSWRAYSWPRLVCLMVFITSWSFLFTSGVLVLGVGMSSSVTSCSMGIVSCIVFYVASKIFIYLFLIEKVHVVSGTSLPRLKSKMYLLCAFSIALYIVIIVLMVLGRVADLREDGACEIGLKKYASVALLGYDLFLNVFLTALFVYPILRSKFVNKKLRTVAIRTMLSALMALTTSTINMLVLTLMHGKQLGFVCLASCGADVTINALVLFYVTWASLSLLITSLRLVADLPFPCSPP